jgi:hypothetical protein
LDLFLFYSIFKLFIFDAGLFFLVFLKYFGNGAGQAGLHSTFWVYSRPSCSCARVARQLRDCSSRNLILFFILLFIFVCCCVLFEPSEKSKWIEEKATRLPGKSNYDAILFSFLPSFFLHNIFGEFLPRCAVPLRLSHPSW